MNMQLSIARGFVRLALLEPGSLFLFNGTLAVKTEYRNEDGGCKCIIIGTGEYFWGRTSSAEELNNLFVQPAVLSPIPS